MNVVSVTEQVFLKDVVIVKVIPWIVRVTVEEQIN